ncbi:MAG: hypothetical protein CSA86_01650 [Arcobacter sp.]|nr:MAG: hypothetical protein CSA86_01650 [Arcobacter sp.]
MVREVNEKTIRLRYIRVLEKFVTKTVSLLKYDNFDKDLFKKATIKAFNELEKTKSVVLYNEYPLAVKNLVQHIMNCIDTHTNLEKEYTNKIFDFEDQKASILKQANLLAKLKNNNRYKKDKHKHKKFNDGY